MPIDRSSGEVAGDTGGVLTVAFDVIGTLFSLDRPRSVLRSLGAPDLAVQLWLATTLRDYFGFSHAGGYRPLKDFLEASLRRLLRELGMEVSDAGKSEVMEAMTELDTAPGAGEAVQAFADAGWRVIAVTNGGADATWQLLSRAGMATHFATVLSCDAVGTSKPHTRVYERAISEAGGELWLIAAHAWDTAGASRAGLRTAWVSHLELEYLTVYPPPDVVADSLAEAAQLVIAAAAGGSRSAR